MNAILAILGLSLLILAHEWGHFVCARKFNMPVREFGIGFPPRAWSRMKNGVEYSINWLPFGGFVKIVGEDGIEDGKEDVANSFARQKIWKRAVVLLAGITINLVIGYGVLVVSNLVGTPPGVVVTEVAKDSPAENAGLKSGDFIRGFAGSSKFIEFTSENLGKEVELNVLGSGGDRKVKLTPRVSPPPGQGAIGVLISDSGAPRMGLGQSLLSAGKDTWEISKMTVLAFASIIKEAVSLNGISSEVMGPVGMVSTARHTVSVGFAYFLRLLGIISINLAVLNLIPFPALDGGRVLFLGVEKIKGSPVPKYVEQWANIGGFLLLVSLMLVLTARDIGRIFS